MAEERKPDINTINKIHIPKKASKIQVDLMICSGQLDNQNIAGIIVDIKNDVFKIVTSSRTIKNWFHRQDLQISV